MTNSISIVGILANIRTEHLPNISLERYRCTSLLGLWTQPSTPFGKCPVLCLKEYGPFYPDSQFLYRSSGIYYNRFSCSVQLSSIITSWPQSLNNPCIVTYSKNKVAYWFKSCSSIKCLLELLVVINLSRYPLRWWNSKVHPHIHKSSASKSYPEPVEPSSHPTVTKVELFPYVLQRNAYTTDFAFSPCGLHITPLDLITLTL
jgi:hypothetical protein